MIDEVEALSSSKQTHLISTVSAPVGAEEIMTQLKIAVGNELIPLLKEGVDVNSALVTVVLKFQTFDAGMNAKVAEADLHYRNLLKNPF